MKHIYQVGDKKVWQKAVQPEDVAAFGGAVVHPVCSTFALGREMEWAARLFVLEMREEEEEGIGTFLEIMHKSPALPGEMLNIEAEIASLAGNELICTLEVRVKDRLVATGRTGQKILTRQVLETIFKELRA